MIVYDIDNIISNIPEKEILTISNNNPRYDEIFMPFINDPELNAVKYTIKTNNEYNNNTKKYYYEFPNFYTDVITNIKTSKECRLFFNKYDHDISITLPIMNMKYTKPYLVFNEESDIIYDVYLFSDEIRNKYKKERLSNKDLMFFMGGAYQYKY